MAWWKIILLIYGGAFVIMFITDAISKNRRRGQFFNFIGYLFTSSKRRRQEAELELELEKERAKERRKGCGRVTLIILGLIVLIVGIVEISDYIDNRPKSATIVRVVPTKHGEIIGTLGKYVRVVDRPYVINNNPNVNSASISVEMELIKKPTVEYAFYGEKDREHGRIRLNVYDTLGTNMMSGFEAEQHFLITVRSNDHGFLYDGTDESEIKKIQELLTSKVGTRSTITFTAYYHYTSGSNLFYKMMVSMRSFDIVDDLVYEPEPKKKK